MLVRVWDHVTHDWGVGEPRVGITLRNVGIRAQCFRLESSQSSSGRLRPLGREEAGGRAHAYLVDGLAGPRSEVFVEESAPFAIEFPLDVGAFSLLAAAPPPATEVQQGRRVAVSCQLFVVAEYEWDAFALPDVRRDWRVDAVRPMAESDQLVTGYMLDLAVLAA